MPLAVNRWQSICQKCTENKLEKCVIHHFLADKSEDYFDEFLIPDVILLKYAKVLDIVYENSSNSCCFTKA